MLSYRHAYHAGNFADVHKHVVLTLVLEALRRKDKPFFVLDTHAGTGHYDLRGALADKLREYEAGIARLWPVDPKGPLPPLYCQALLAENPHPKPLRRYPGSPACIHAALRPGDRAVCVELHSSDYPALSRYVARLSRARLVAEQGDGLAAIAARLPPHERRGLVLIDPSYEVKADYEAVAIALLDGHRRWATGIYALWYPLLEGSTRSEELCARLQQSGVRKILQSELLLHEPGSGERGMYGSGMLVINAPWKLDEELTARLPLIAQALAPDGGRARLRWLVPE